MCGSGTTSRSRRYHAARAKPRPAEQALARWAWQRRRSRCFRHEDARYVIGCDTDIGCARRSPRPTRAPPESPATVNWPSRQTVLTRLAPEMVRSHDGSLAGAGGHRRRPGTCLTIPPSGERMDDAGLEELKRDRQDMQAIYPAWSAGFLVGTPPVRRRRSAARRPAADSRSARPTRNLARTSIYPTTLSSQATHRPDHEHLKLEVVPIEPPQKSGSDPTRQTDKTP